MVRGDVFGAEALGQLVRHALGQAPRVHRDQRGAMRLDQPHEAVVDLLPHLVRHHRFERRTRHFDREVHLCACGPCRRSTQRLVGQEPARPPRSASASPKARCAAACGRRRGRGARATSARCAPRRDCSTAWISSTITTRAVFSIARERSAVSSRYSDSGVVTRMCGGVRSIAARSVCGVSPLRTAAVILTGGSPSLASVDLAPRLGEVLVDVRRQRLQRRDIDDPHLVGQSALLGPSRNSWSIAVRKAASVLPGAGRRRDQRVRAAPDRAPAFELGGGRLAEAARPTSAAGRDGNLGAAKRLLDRSALAMSSLSPDRPGCVIRASCGRSED